MPALVLLPVVPCLAQRASEHLLELAAEERVAVGRAVVEADELVVAILPCEVADEARAVEIGVGTHLEVHGGALGLQSHHREQLVAAIDDAAEVHLVVAAQGASYASAHPGLHETGYALVIPARRIPAGHAQVAPQGRQGMLVVGRHLGSAERGLRLGKVGTSSTLLSACTALGPIAPRTLAQAEEAAPGEVAAVVLVGHHHVGVLMVEQVAVTLSRGIDVICLAQRCHANLNHRMGQRRHTAVAFVLPVGNHQQRCLGAIERIGGPYLFMKRFAVVIHAHDMGDVARQALVEEHQPRLVGRVLVVRLTLSPREHGDQRQQYGYCIAHPYLLPNIEASRRRYPIAVAEIASEMLERNMNLMASDSCALRADAVALNPPSIWSKEFMTWL